MAVTTVQLSDTIDNWRIRFNEIVSVSNAQISAEALNNLTTNDKNTVVGAINEIVTRKIDANGSVTPSADLPMGNFKHTGVGKGDARNQYASLAQIQDGEVFLLSAIGGTANVITASAPYSLPAMKAGQFFGFVVGTTNSGAVTLNISTRGAIPVTKLGMPLVDGDLTAGDFVVVGFDGTKFFLWTPARTPVLKNGSVPLSALQSTIGFVETGSICEWGGSIANIPSDYYFCNGAEKNRITDAALFAKIGTKHGIGDGINTFNLPNRMNRFPLGADSDDNGVAKTTLQDGLQRQTGGLYNGKTGGHTLTMAEAAGVSTVQAVNGGSNVMSEIIIPRDGSQSSFSGAYDVNGSGSPRGHRFRMSDAPNPHDHPLDLPPYYAAVYMIKR